MIEIGTRVTVNTIAGNFSGIIVSYDETTGMYKILKDDDGRNLPERLRYVGSTTVTPIEQEQQS